MLNATKQSAINDVRYYSLCSSCPLSTTAPWQWPPTQRIVQASNTRSLLRAGTTTATSNVQDTLTKTTLTSSVRETSAWTSTTIRIVSSQTSAVPLPETAATHGLPVDLVTLATHPSTCKASSSLGACSSMSSRYLTSQTTSPVAVKSTASLKANSPSATSLLPSLKSIVKDASSTTQTRTQQSTMALMTSSGSELRSSSLDRSTTASSARSWSSISTTATTTQTHTGFGSSVTPSSNTAPATQANHIRPAFATALTIGIVFSMLSLFMLARFLHRCYTVRKRQIMSDSCDDVDFEAMNAEPDYEKSQKPQSSSLLSLQPRLDAPVPPTPVSISSKSWPLDTITTQVLSRNADAHRPAPAEIVGPGSPKAVTFSANLNPSSVRQTDFLVPPPLHSPWSWASSRTSTATMLSRISYDSRGQRRRSDPFDLEGKW